MNSGYFPIPLASWVAIMLSGAVLSVTLWYVRKRNGKPIWKLAGAIAAFAFLFFGTSFAIISMGRLVRQQEEERQRAINILIEKGLSMTVPLDQLILETVVIHLKFATISRDGAMYDIRRAMIVAREKSVNGVRCLPLAIPPNSELARLLKESESDITLVQTQDGICFDFNQKPSGEPAGR